jgi:MFS family permease
VVRLLLPLVAKHVREHAVVAGAMVVTAVLFGVYPLLPSALAMGLCSVLLGFALGSVQPMVMSLLHQITPEHRHGEALGLRLMAINASSVVMPMLFGTAGASLAWRACSGWWVRRSVRVRARRGACGRRATGGDQPAFLCISASCRAWLRRAAVPSGTS